MWVESPYKNGYFHLTSVPETKWFEMFSKLVKSQRVLARSIT